MVICSHFATIMVLHRTPFLLLAALFIPTTAFAAFTGPVVSVLDGDTIEVLHDTRTERIRLNGIDCPEKGQGYGHKAKQAASALVFERKLRFRHTTSTSTAVPLQTCCCAMVPTSIMNW